VLVRAAEAQKRINDLEKDKAGMQSYIDTLEDELSRMEGEKLRLMNEQAHSVMMLKLSARRDEFMQKHVAHLELQIERYRLGEPIPILVPDASSQDKETEKEAEDDEEEEEVEGSSLLLADDPFEFFSDEDFLTLKAVSKNHYSILMHYLNGDVGEGQSVTTISRHCI